LHKSVRVTLNFMKDPTESVTRARAGRSGKAAAHTRFERLKQQEQRLRALILDFSASENVPREKLYRRGVDDPTRPRGK
jgi:hypothetical protein